MSDKFNEMISCKDESFFTKIKRKIFSFFSRRKKPVDVENSEQSNIIIPTGLKVFEKKEFFKIYNKIKSEEIDLNEIDEETLYKVITMLDEEMTVNSRKIDDQMKMIEININSLKMYNSSIKALNKN